MGMGNCKVAGVVGLYLGWSEVLTGVLLEYLGAPDRPSIGCSVCWAGDEDIVPGLPGSFVDQDVGATDVLHLQLRRVVLQATHRGSARARNKHPVTGLERQRFPGLVVLI
jgi:hypothetical protein